MCLPVLEKSSTTFLLIRQLVQCFRYELSHVNYPYSLGDAPMSLPPESGPPSLYYPYLSNPRDVLPERPFIPYLSVVVSADLARSTIKHLLGIPIRYATSWYPARLLFRAGFRAFSYHIPRSDWFVQAQVSHGLLKLPLLRLKLLQTPKLTYSKPSVLIRPAIE